MRSFEWPTRPYTWRGRTYKTISGLHTAVLKVHPHSALGFDADAMVVTERGKPPVRYRRDLETNEIAAEAV